MKGENRKINILFLIDMLWHVSGTERHLYYLVKYLDKAKYNCVIATFDLKEMFVQEIREEGVKVYEVPLRRHYSPLALVQAVRLRKIIRDHKIDIVQTFHFKSDTYGVMVAKLSGVKCIVSSRRDTGDLKKNRQICLNRLVNRFVDRFVVVCDRVGRTIADREGLAREKMFTIYNGVDTDLFSVPSQAVIEENRRKLNYSKEDFIVGMVANFRGEKDYETFLKGMKLARSGVPSLKVLLVGMGPLYDYCQRMCEEYGLADITRFTGLAEDIYKYISIIDVGCLVPKANEGFSNAILEKMAAAKPLIVTDIGGNAEAVVHGENGVVIKPGDHKGLADAVIELNNNIEQRKLMGRMSRERVEKEFTIRRMIERHEGIYDATRRMGLQ